MDTEEPRLRKERTVQLNVPIPYQLRDRLDAILKELGAAGAPDASLKEVVAMLVLHSEEDQAKLFAKLLDYRNALPERAAFAIEVGTVLPFRQRGRGRPRK
jgi:hypothetical protein